MNPYAFDYFTYCLPPDSPAADNLVVSVAGPHNPAQPNGVLPDRITNPPSPRGGWDTMLAVISPQPSLL